MYEVTDITTVIMGILGAVALFSYTYMLSQMDPFCYYVPYALNKYYKVHRETGVKFDDIIGCENIKLELKNMCKDFVPGIRNNSFKGFYFWGQPGTGKTFMAKAVASLVKVPFVEMRCDDIPLEQTKRVFNTIVSKYAPCIILIDESNKILAAHLELFLSKLDGMDTANNIVLIMTSNLQPPDNLSRSGRLTPIKFLPPSYDDRLALIKKFNLPYCDDITERTSDFTQADIAFIAKNFHNKTDSLTNQGYMSVINEAIDNIQFGRQTSEFKLETENLTRIIYHEIGHALVSLVLREKIPPVKISTECKNVLLGHTIFNVSGNNIFTRQDYINRIATLSASKFFEEYYCGDSSSTFKGDLSEIRSTIVAMEQAGMIPVKSVRSRELVIENILQSLEEVILTIINDHAEVIENLKTVLIIDRTLYKDRLNEITSNKLKLYPDLLLDPKTGRIYWA